MPFTKEQIDEIKKRLAKVKEIGNQLINLGDFSNGENLISLANSGIKGYESTEITTISD